MRTPRPRSGLHCSLAALALLCAAAPTPARASDLELRIGLKGALTLADQLSASAPPTPTAPFLHASMGVGYGGGLYGELHASKLLGVELDLLLQSNRVYFDATANDVDFSQRARFGQFRVPLLGKLFLHPSDDFELNVGLGPELIAGLGSSARTEVDANRTTLSNANVQRSLDYFYRAKAGLGAAVALELGCSIYTLRFQIPIALRFAYNVLGKSAYDERVKQDMKLRTATLDAVESYQIALVIGFGFLIPPREPPPAPAAPTGPKPDDPFAPLSGR
jgi:hypothetical protein